jgi:hypothetical protein
MKNITAAFFACVLLSPILYAETPAVKGSFVCRVNGGITVDSLFRAIPPDRIAIDAERQKSRPEELDRANGYLKMSFKDTSGNTITYTAALYTAGQKNSRIFLMVTRDVHYIAQFPFTEGFWIFEYSPGMCAAVTDAILPLGHEGGLIKLPRKGTDLVRCVLIGDTNGMREECTTYAWNLKEAKFIKKK